MAFNNSRILIRCRSITSGLNEPDPGLLTAGSLPSFVFQIIRHLEEDFAIWDARRGQSELRRGTLNKLCREFQPQHFFFEWSQKAGCVNHLFREGRRQYRAGEASTNLFSSDVIQRNRRDCVGRGRSEEVQVNADHVVRRSSGAFAQMSDAERKRCTYFKREESIG